MSRTTLLQICAHMLAAVIGTAAAISVDYIGSTLAVAVIWLYFSLTSFLRFRSGLGMRDTQLRDWAGSIGTLLALGAGASFFVLFGYEGFPNAAITTTSVSGGDHFLKLLMLMLAPITAGIFTYYFVSLCVRIPHPRAYLSLYGLAFVLLLGMTIALVLSGWTVGVASLRFSGIICFATGGLISVGYLSVIATRMIFKRLVYDIAIMSAVIFAYYPITASTMRGWLANKDAGITEVAFAQTACLIGMMILFTLVASAYRWTRCLLSQQTVARSEANAPNPSLIGASLRSVAGLASNYSVVLSPLALFSFIRNIGVLQHDLRGQFAVDSVREVECRKIAGMAAIAHLLVLTVPALLSLMVPVDGIIYYFTRIVGCAIGSALCWHLLGRVDALFVFKGAATKQVRA